MKIEKQEIKFNPVSFTIESQEEAELLLVILAKTSGGHADDMLYKMFNALGGNDVLDVARFEATSGSIRVEEKN